MEPESTIIENEVLWETRDRFRRELLDQLREGLEGAAHKVEGGSEDGVTVVTDRGWRAALNRIEGQRLPPIDHHYAEVLTGAIVTVWAKCPRCGIANTIAMSVDPVLTIDTHTAELKLKAKAKARSHVCGQLTLMESGAQATLEVEIESLVKRVHDLLLKQETLDPWDVPTRETVAGWDRATIDQVEAWAEAAITSQNGDLNQVVPPLPRVLGGEADPEPTGEDIIADDASAVDFGEGAPADDDLLPGENLDACPWPGCELAVEHPGQHQTAADDRPDEDGPA